MFYICFLCVLPVLGSDRAGVCTAGRSASLVQTTASWRFLFAAAQCFPISTEERTAGGAHTSQQEASEWVIYWYTPTAHTDYLLYFCLCRCISSKSSFVYLVCLFVLSSPWFWFLMCSSFFLFTLFHSPHGFPDKGPYYNSGNNTCVCVWVCGDGRWPFCGSC